MNTPGPPRPLTFTEALHYYFEAGNELYEAKVRGTDSEKVDVLERFIDSLLAELTKAADEKGLGKELQTAVRTERRLKSALFGLEGVPTN